MAHFDGNTVNASTSRGTGEFSGPRKRLVLVDSARARARAKHGDRARNRQQGIETASEALSRDDESLARVIEMKYFGGMTAEEMAEALSRSFHVVHHDLGFAEAWLRRKLSR